MTVDDVVRLVAEALQLGDRAESMDTDTQLLGAMPEFDSMAVVTIITSAEEQFGLAIDDEAISAEVFETVGSLYAFLSAQC